MTSTEFAAARERLGWTLIEAAVEYNVTPNVIEGFERGSVRIPNAIARDIRFRSVVKDRQAVLAASALPECAVAVDLNLAVVGKKGDDLISATDAFLDHVKSCELCRQRGEYVERHGPPLPDLPTSVLFRIGGWANWLLDRLPGIMRPPEGKAGDGRRIGFLIGGALSALACGMVLLFIIARVTHGVRERWWQGLGWLGFLIPAYFVGFYLAGWVWDVLRPVHDRFIGYVLRWWLAGVAIYGTVALVMPFMDDEPTSLQEAVGIVGIISSIWALIGAGLWIKDRLWGKLAKR